MLDRQNKQRIKNNRDLAFGILIVKFENIKQHITLPKEQPVPSKEQTALAKNN
jgi:hypothetical protein